MKGISIKVLINRGKIVIDDPKQKNIYETFLEEMDGIECVLRLEKWYRGRTNKQNRYYWGVIISILNNELAGADDPNDIHEYLKDQFIPKIDFLGSKISKGTSRMTTMEFEEYASKIRMWASRDWHVFIPEPNEAPGFAYKPEELNKDDRVTLDL